MTSPFRGFGGSSFMPPTNGQSMVPPNLGPVIRLAALAGGIIVLLLLLNWFRNIYTNFLWFGNLGYSDVFRTILLTRVWLFLLGAGIFSAFAGINVFLTYRFGKPPAVAPLPDETLRLLRPATLIGASLVVLLAALIFGASAAGRWETILGFLNATTFGIVDPQFGRDIEFYVFKLPIFHLVQGWMLGAVVVSLLFSMGMYFVHFSLRGAVFTFTNPIRIHLSILGALILFILAWGYWLDVFDLVFSSAGAVVGATYTDVSARMPALRILMAVVALGGIILLANAFIFRNVRLIVGIIILWLGALIILNGLLPSVVQRIQVNPNELRREAPYIERNIEMTRAAFGLDRIEERNYPLAPGAAVTQSLVSANRETVDNIRLWDYRPFRSLVNQIQFHRLYYTFPNADVDRYLIEENGETRMRQVMLATRELDADNLPEEAQNWVNRKLQFTHGYGAVMAPVTEVTEEGRPVFFLKDIPPDDSVIALERPEVYYGESREEFVIVNSNQAELDFEPEVGDPIYQAYEGSGGVQLSSFFRRVAYALQFRDFNVLISGEINSQSRVQYHRTIAERILTVAPFLILDSDPYIVISEGRLFWIQDAYTTTDRYPYSTPFQGQINYIRNSVKVVLDVYNGDLDFYVAEPEDPLIITKQKIFPVLFKPLDAMPPDLRTHIRYPQDLFSIQAEQYLTYHMTDPTEFFNKADQWSVPQELLRGTFQPMESYFLNMRLPGEKRDEFVLLLPFTPKDRENMVGWLAARSDGEEYGKLVSFAFPKGIEINGPAQVEKRISQDFEIKQQLTLLCPEGGEVSCIRGNLLVIPMEEDEGDNRILYAEPLYLQVETGDRTFPELKRVILADGSQVAMEGTLDQAIAALTGEERPLPAAPPSGAAQPADRPTGDLADALRRELTGVNAAFESLQRQITELQRALRDLQDLAEGRVQ